ncbi:enoyl-(Acyl carrier protein) reductase [Hirsutella rhossiliensis]|uniref:Enoyl-(Acyl carrier protein) reductase domain-containing protein n=1 Tax=Hirsutella rhossiliensis TaxID=111463 RepID=A0A9P8SEX6_9HYPO|nr:enoyl-(Acyl carrier protein) reductase domain-containing protein [Hirsutella rhossiliensis]KAH0958835.1 enoyl-(Acyl carrier protein) reductase domain-containing protein [Hirsutella rhossiliensis]
MAEAQLNNFPSLFSLRGKVAVVTGGSRGLGLHAASAFLQAGASTVFISSRKAAACDAACKALNALPNLAPGARAIPVPADSATPQGVRHLLAEVKKHTDKVDILLANAGATWGAEFDKHPDEAFAKVMNLNVRAVFNTVRDFAPLLEEAARQGGADGEPSRVIITASVAGLGIGTIGPQGTYGYSASKAAVIHLGRNLAVELGPRRITVNSICPGFFPSKMSNGLLDMAGGADVIAEGNPMGRLGRPEDIAGAVVYLASRAGSHVNGEAIAIDGGAVWARGELMRGGDSKL